jgi:hypothetical protein
MCMVTVICSVPALRLKVTKSKKQLKEEKASNAGLFIIRYAINAALLFSLLNNIISITHTKPFMK